jgi:inosose dehydratase
VHLKDVDVALAARVRSGDLGYRDAVRLGMYRPLGDGDLDVRAFLEVLAALGYEGWYVLEQDVVLSMEPAAGTGPMADAARSVDFLRRAMSR